MPGEFILNQLEELAAKLGIAIRYEPVNLEESSEAGGLCRFKGRYVLIIHSQASADEKIRLIAKAVKQFPINGIYLKPVIRKLLEDLTE